MSLIRNDISMKGIVDRAKCPWGEMICKWGEMSMGKDFSSELSTGEIP